jgi:hypothetical protein
MPWSSVAVVAPETYEGRRLIIIKCMLKANTIYDPYVNGLEQIH